MSDDITTWQVLFAEARKQAGDNTPIVASTLDPYGWSKAFDSGFGGSEGQPFTTWSETRVYFPAVYDGAEWVASVPRNPCDEATKHVGGE